MSDTKTERKPKRWNNGWIGLMVLLTVFSSLFIAGLQSGTSAPDPVVEGRRLSQWSDELLHVDPIAWSKHDDAVEVLRRHEQELKPILIQWLDTRNTLPQAVYFSTMALLERFGRAPLDDRGAYSIQYRAAKAFRALGASDPSVIAALERNLEHYRSEEAGTKESLARLDAITEAALHKK